MNSVMNHTCNSRLLTSQSHNKTCTSMKLAFRAETKWTSGEEYPMFSNLKHCL